MAFALLRRELLLLSKFVKKAVIFDLDNCLAPASEVGEELFQPAFDAIRQANRDTLSQACLQRAFDDVWHHPLDWVAQHHHFSTDMLAAAWEQFRVLQVVRPMHGYADLPILSEMPIQRFLVTSGFRRLQESKIMALGIQDLFAAVFVDAIDEPKSIGKKGLFRQFWRSMASRQRMHSS